MHCRLHWHIDFHFVRQTRSWGFLTAMMSHESWYNIASLLPSIWSCFMLATLTWQLSYFLLGKGWFNRLICHQTHSFDVSGCWSLATWRLFRILLWSTCDFRLIWCLTLARYGGCLEVIRELSGLVIIGKGGIGVCCYVVTAWENMRKQQVN